MSDGKNLDSIESSDSFIAIYTKDYAKDQSCALQLGTAILLGKPIALVAEEGEEIPRNLTLLASSVQYFKKGDEASFEQAVKRTVSKMKGDSK